MSIFSKDSSIYLKYGLCRSILALSLLLTLTFSDDYILFPYHFWIDFQKIIWLDYFNLFHIFSYDNLYISRIVASVILIVVITGYFPFFFGVLHFWVAYSFFYSSLIIDGGDQISMILSLIFIPLTLSDFRKNTFIKFKRDYSFHVLISNIIMTIVTIQISIIYFVAAIDKIYKLEEWRNGTAIYYWVNDNLFGLQSSLLTIINSLFQHTFIVTSITWGVIFIELLLSISFFFEWYIRKCILSMGILFHILIAVFLGIPTFSLTMIGILIFYLLPNNHVFQIIKK